MPTVNDGKVLVTLTGTEVNSIADGGVSSSVGLPSPVAGGTGAFAGKLSRTMTTGTGNNQVNAVVSLTGTITAGSPVDLDLKALVQGAGTLALTGVKHMLIQEVSPTPNSANNLQVGDDAGTLTNGWWSPFQTASHADIIQQGSGRYYGSYFGFVVDNTHKVLRLKAAAGTAIYQIDMLATK